MADLNRVRRRAQQFARLVDGAVPPPSPVQDPELAHAAELVEAMREAGAVQPSAEFSATLRQRLIAEAQGRITATPTVPSDPILPSDPDLHDEDGDDADPATAIPLHGPRRRRGRIIAGAAAFVVLAGGVGSAAAAQQSMPGDALYPLKRGLESVASKVSVTDDSRGRRDLSHALARLTEAETLVDDNTRTDATVDTLHDFSAEARSGADHLLASFRSDNDASAVDKIYVFAGDAQVRLVSLTGRAPAAVRPAITDALRTVSSIVQQGVKACPICVLPKPLSTLLSGSVSSTQPQRTDPSTQPSQPGRTVPTTPGVPAQSPTVHIPQLPPTGPIPGTGVPTLVPSLPTTILPSLPSLPVTLPPQPPTLPTVSLPLPSVTLPLSLPTTSLPLPPLPLN